MLWTIAGFTLISPGLIIVLFSGILFTLQYQSCNHTEDDCNQHIRKCISNDSIHVHEYPVKYEADEPDDQIDGMNILVSGNLDSGILETDIPEDGNSLIGLFTTYQVVRYCQAQSRFAVL